jgi:hypothetical protein
MDPLKAASAGPTAPASAAAATPAAAPPAEVEPSAPVVPDPSRPGAGPVEASDLRPLLPPEIAQYFVPVRGEPPPGNTPLYRPMIFGFAEVYFNDTRSGVSTTETVGRLSLLSQGVVALDWPIAARVGLTPDDLQREPVAPARFESLPPPASKARSYTAWTKTFVDSVYRGETLDLLKSPSLGTYSAPSETERDFRLRLQQAAREERDARLEKLRAKYAPKLQALEDKLRRARQVVEREESQAWSTGVSDLIKIGTTVLGAVVGRKKLSTTAKKAGSVIRGASQTAKESADAARARETLESLRRQYQDLQAEFDEECEQVLLKTNPLTESLEPVTLKPKKTNITPKLVALVWVPFWAGADGKMTSAWD